MTISSPTLRSRPHIQPAVSHSVSQWLVLIAGAYLLTWLAGTLSNCLQAAFWFDGYPVNGPFQLYDPLRRLAAGQRAGIDFQFFHGIGIPFLHLPLFKLFGGHTLLASELSRQFTSLLLFIGTLALFCSVAVRSAYRKALNGWGFWPTVTVSAAAVLLLLEAFFPHSAEPGHSLISGRSSMPLVAFAILLTSLPLLRKALLFGVAVGCAFVFGTEHGIALCLALMLLFAVSLLQGLLQRSMASVTDNLKFISVAFLTAALTGGTVLVSFCGLAGAKQAIHYNLSELPADQFWFFGSPPMPYLTSLRQLLFDRHVLLCFLPSELLALLALTIVLRHWRQPFRFADSRWFQLAPLMLTYGVLTAIPLVAILSRHYVYPQTRILLLAALAAWLQTPNFQLPRKAVAYTMALVAVASTIFIIYRTSQSLLSWSHHRHGQALAAADPTLDDHWNKFLQGATAVIDSHRKQPAVSLWSEYVALLDAHYGVFQPAEDYIIHAVGPERWPRYIDRFRRAQPEFVATMTSQFSFAEWLQDERWEFYDELISNYRPLQDVEHDTIWQRSGNSWVEPSQAFDGISLEQATTGTNTITLPRQVAGTVMVVRLGYEVHNPWKKLPLLGNTPRYLVQPAGTHREMAISLPQYRDRFTFPVEQTGEGPVTLHFRCDSFLPGAALRIESLSYKILDRSPAVATLFTPRRIPSRY